MADGDITAIKELGRYTIPGGGSTLSGIAKNNKVMVWGEMTATYVAAGLDLDGVGGVAAFGVETLDFINFEVKTISATDPATVIQFSAYLARATNKIFMIDEGGAPAKPDDAEAVVISYLACGDSNAAPELT